MTTMAEHADHHYSIVVGEDHGSVLIEEHPTLGWVRYHYRVFRVPSQQRFTLRHCADATPADRERAERVLASLPAGGWATLAAWGELQARAGDGAPCTYLWLGSRLDDPLMQLELEMMLDLASELTV
ncbi:hypothetical protein [Microbacterium caowuchunii]|uniref:Uncharacterized protein n=1 Tax=Microbacterium caowuchunii TaxID=2614638 RepID=A0A5N0TI90_9MICO|nr:hypothetical protein [Microbacterium caowuchunii]KAA9134843.1 hypothetical protein F6B40_03860 [Microbacterium caowuchunii]